MSTSKVLQGVVIAVAASAVIFVGKRLLSGGAMLPGNAATGPNFVPRTAPPSDLIEV